MALRVLDGSDGVEEFPVWFSGVEQDSDPVVGEAAEPERDPFDLFDQVVDRRQHQHRPTQPTTRTYA